jgi:hypothetical protein
MLNFAGRAGTGLTALVHHDIDNLDQLREHVQIAIQLEFTTIPAYLSALYSIVDKSSLAYEVLRSIVVEEMFHVNQAANLLVGIGGHPRFTGPVAPVYPAYLPSANKSATPYVGLYRASLPVFQNVFMAIETPAPWNAPAEGENYTTIGQYYKAIDDGIETCVRKYGAPKVFQQVPGARQRSDIYLGKFGGRAGMVHDLRSARFGIRQIVQQGEGAVDPTRTLVPDQPFGAYNYYGMRLDGTYGPILGTPFELSHYFKFKHIVDSGIFPDTYPSVSNPRVSEFQNEKAKQAATTFNKYYSVILKGLELTFANSPPDHDVYFEVVLPLMHGHLPTIAKQLVNTPINPDGDPTIGPNAAATFEYDPKANLAELIGMVETMRNHSAPQRIPALALAPASTTSPETPPEQVRYRALSQLAADLRKLRDRAQAANFAL